MFRAHYRLGSIGGGGIGPDQMRQFGLLDQHGPPTSTPIPRLRDSRRMAPIVAVS